MLRDCVKVGSVDDVGNGLVDVDVRSVAVRSVEGVDTIGLRGGEGGLYVEKGDE